MWVYTREDALSRVNLPDGEAFWLDYWLLLHADETHAVLCWPPLSMQSIAKIARDLASPIDNTLFEAIGTELEGYHSLSRFFKKPLPGKPALIKRRGEEGRKIYNWSNEWLEKLELFNDPSESLNLLNCLSDDLANAINHQDLKLVAFLTRIISRELAYTYSSKRALFQRAKQLFFHERHLSLEDRLKTLISPPATQNYTVNFKVGRVEITSKIAKLRFATWTTLVVEKETRFGKVDEDPRQILVLTGIESSVTASHPERAVEEALLYCQEVLHQLRVRHYIRTHLIGAVCVRDSSGENNHLSLNQPFWTKKGGRREVPHIPMFHKTLKNLHASKQSQWIAARWHISQAIGVWPEDTHTAASEVWQALESFAGSQKNVKNQLVEKYLDLFTEDILDHLAVRVGYQVLALNNCGITNSWFHRNRYDTLEKWLGKVLDSRSTYHYRKWSPTAPAILFDPEIGLITNMARHYKGFCTEESCRVKWLKPRVKQNLDFLYGVRNAVVHKGMRIGTTQLAGYLARLGLEILLMVMSDEATKLEGSNIAEA